MAELKCRCCSARLDAQSISFRLDVKEASDSGLTLKDKLLECVPEIKIPDKSEDVICVNCFSLLTSAYNFRKMCLKTNERLNAETRPTETVFVEAPIVPKTEADSDKASEGDADDAASNDFGGAADAGPDEGPPPGNLNANAESDLDESVGSDLECGVPLDQLPTKVDKLVKDGEAVHVCDQCKTMFLWRENYLLHDCEGTKTCRKCSQCDVSFRSDAIYEMHMKFMHAQNYSVYKVDDAKRRKLSVENKEDDIPKETVTVTEPTATSPDTKLVKKTVFNKKTANAKVVLKNNKKTNVKSPKRKEEKRCLLCKKVFLNPLALQRHLHAHEEYCYRCLQCNHLETNKDDHKILTKCESTDFATPTFTNTRCPFCFKHFPTLQGLQEHISNYNNFKMHCFTCHTQFKTIWEMTLHHIATSCTTSQLIKNAPMEGDTISCPVCKKDFSARHHLVAHFRNHRANTLVCSECEIPFYGRQAYTDHLEHCVPVKLEEEQMVDFVQVKQEVMMFVEDGAVASGSNQASSTVLLESPIIKQEQNLEHAMDVTSIDDEIASEGPVETLVVNVQETVVITDEPQTVATPEETETVATVEKTQTIATAEKTQTVATIEKTQTVATTEKTQPVATTEETQTVATTEKTQTATTTEEPQTVATTEETQTVTTTKKAQTVTTKEPKTVATTEEPQTAATTEEPQTVDKTIEPESTKPAVEAAQNIVNSVVKDGLNPPSEDGKDKCNDVVEDESNQPSEGGKDKCNDVVEDELKQPSEDGKEKPKDEAENSITVEPARPEREAEEETEMVTSTT